MSKTYYLDESGNTGDAIRIGDELDFGDQPMFTLACIGIDDIAALEAELTTLKARHKVRGVELRSSSIRGKPQFVLDLATYLKKQRAPIFIEVVDKKLFICAHVVSSLFLPPVGEFDPTPEAHFLRNTIAEYLCAYMPDAAMRSIVNACDAPSKEAVACIFSDLINWLTSRPSHDEIATGAKRLIEDTRAEFEQLAPDEDFLRFLPMPDKGKRGQTYWMLPNLSSFTNIYARINLYHRRKLFGVELVHDEQAHFDRILVEAKAAAERISSSNHFIEVPHADYRFLEKADLRFEKSVSSIGLQAADCLAGFVMRHVLSALTDPRLPDEVGLKGFQEILSVTDARFGVGINFVLSSVDVSRLESHFPAC